MPTGPMTMGPQGGSAPRGPMGSGSLGMGAMNNSLMPGGMGVSDIITIYDVSPPAQTLYCFFCRGKLITRCWTAAFLSSARTPMCRR